MSDIQSKEQWIKAVDEGVALKQEEINKLEYELKIKRGGPEPEPEPEQESSNRTPS